MMSTAEIIVELQKLSREELTRVHAKLTELLSTTPATIDDQPIAGHVALGIWKNRTDLPQDSIEASRLLRERMMRRVDTTPS